MRTLRYNASPNDFLEDGDVRVRGGETAKFSDEDAERLLADPLIDVTDVDPFEGALDAYKREELNEIAAQAGVENPESLPNKDAVIAAIHDNQPTA